jgi:hypothetical protein
VDKNGAQQAFLTLKRAVEGGDRDALTALYADDVEFIGYSKNNMPSRPLRFSGRDSIDRELKEVFEREPERQKAGYPEPTFPWVGEFGPQRQTIVDEVVGEDRFSYMMVCDYGQGLQLVSASTAYVQDGRIIREITLETWDE